MWLRSEACEDDEHRKTSGSGKPNEIVNLVKLVNTVKLVNLIVTEVKQIIYLSGVLQCVKNQEFGFGALIYC